MQTKKKLSLIGKVSEIVKIPSVQIAIVLVVLEGVKAITESNPSSFVEYLQSALLVVLPVVRILKREVKDD